MDRPERRKCPRIKTAWMAKYSYFIAFDGTQHWDMTAIVNISETGFCATTLREFAVGEVLSFEIKVPSRPLAPVKVKARVVESAMRLTPFFEQPIAGTFFTRVEFVEMNEEDREVIKGFVKWFFSKQGGKQ